jgi:uncharacterized protein (TIGR03435 family)
MPIMNAFTLTSNRRRPTGPARTWLAGAALVAVLGVGMAGVAGTSTTAQSGSPDGERLAFEAATIKRARPDAIRNQVVPSGPGRMNIPSMTLVWLVYTAYADGMGTAFRVEGGPDWANRDSFEVMGVAPGPATPRQRRLMLRTLLEDRFALTLRTDVQVGAPDSRGVYALVRDGDRPLGPNVEPWDGTCANGAEPLEEDPFMPRCVSGYRPPGLRLDGVNMFAAAEALSLPPSRALLGTIVQDKTGITGRYRMTLDFRFPPWGAAGRGAPPPELAGPSLFTAVQEQWGLRLEPSSGTLTVLTIERAQPPTEN